MEKILYFPLILFLCFNLVAQNSTIDFSNYQNIEHSGSLPADVTSSSASKYQKDSRTISEKEKKVVRKAEEQFYKESNFVLDELVASGKVYFNDPITQYVNDVADELLKNDVKLRKRLKIYTVKNGSANAFTTNDGKILVNWGLLNILENEAQLAAILAHEIIHYRDRHVIKSFKESVAIGEGIGIYKRVAKIDKLTAKTNFSKELEEKADLQGLSIYLKSNYNPTSFSEIFDVLSYAHVPFEDKEFSLQYFDSEGLFALPDNYLEATTYYPIEAINSEESETHPALLDRQEKVDRKLLSKTENNGLFLVSEQRFQEVQKMARYELSKLFLYYKEYPLAIYHSWLLLEKDPKSAYLHKNILKGVYAIAKIKSFGVYEELKTDWNLDSIQGKSTRVYHFFDHLPSEAASVLALTLGKRFLLNYDSKDLEVNAMMEDLIEEMVIFENYDSNTFRTKTEIKKRQKEAPKKESKKSPIVETKPTTKVFPEELTEKDKTLMVEKINQIQKEFPKKSLAEIVNIYYGREYGGKPSAMRNIEIQEIVLGIKKKKKVKAPEIKTEPKSKTKIKNITFDASFVANDFKNVITKASKKKKEITGERKGENYDDYYSYRKEGNKKGYGINLDRVVFLDPFYSRTDYRKKYPVDYLESEAAKSELIASLKKNTELLGIDMNVLSSEKMGKNNAEAFADMSFLKLWIIEKLSNGPIKLVSIDYERAQNLSKKYQTNKVIWTGVTNIVDYRDLSSLEFAAAFYVPPYLFTLLSPNHKSYFYTFLFDLAKDELELPNYIEVKRKDNKGTLNSTIYGQLWELTR